jgi:hypothetical protein
MGAGDPVAPSGGVDSSLSNLDDWLTRALGRTFAKSGFTVAFASSSGFCK